MKINQRFIVKLGLGFVLIGGVVALVGFALSGFSPDAYATNQQSWYRTFYIGGGDLSEAERQAEAWEERLELAEESREQEAEKQAERAEEKSEAVGELQETLTELRSEARELQGADPQKAAAVEALITELEKTIAN